MNATASPQTSPALGHTEIDILGIMITRYTTVAGVVILLYDCLLTIGDEVRIGHSWAPWSLILFVGLQIRLVWPGHLTAAKLLYYINRYMSILGVVASNYRASAYLYNLTISL